MKITVETEITASPSTVWDAWVTPDDIKNWNFATDEWCCPRADINLVVGGKFNSRMEAKDGSMGFDLEGEFTEIDPQKYIRYKLEDGREVSIEFINSENTVKVIETFDAEDEHSTDHQRQGWQSILNNFKKHVESKGD
ncbi:MAG: SRPBCC family protein [Acidiferrobacterales bacterium]|nr:SRPBCC family protein [Acidiferrobacterales bacterium]